MAKDSVNPPTPHRDGFRLISVDRKRSDADDRASRLSLLRDVEAWPLAYHTAKNMQPRQLLGIVERKLRHQVVSRLPVDFDAWYEQQVPPATSAAPDALWTNTRTLRNVLPPDCRRRFRDLATVAATDGEVTFLDHTVDVGGPEGVEWTGAAVTDPPALWALKFHGFEFLRWAVLGFDGPEVSPAVHETFMEWIRDWMAADETRVGRQRYLRGPWTPHAVSLRLLNGSRYYAWCAAHESETSTEASFLSDLRRLLYKNALFLENHVEYDVGGNHLIENGAALAVAGLLLDEDGERWVERGLDVLSEAAGQFLDDGGHFERSPMYHVLSLVRYLTVLDVLLKAGRGRPAVLERPAAAGTGFLEAIRPPDDRIPLLNDSVYGEALPLEACLEYAREIGVEPTRRASTDSGALAASGYYWLGEGGDRLLVDGGGIGPPHLPAHSHNDHFAVLFWADGVQLLADTGVYEYAPTPRRQYSRSVAAHNTVQVGDEEPIDIGGSYLLGRRIEPRVRYGTENGVTYFDGIYRKATVRGTRYEHRRRVYSDGSWWLVDDCVTSEVPRTVRSRLHCHPAVDVVPADGTSADQFELSTASGEQPSASLVSLGADSSLSSSSYFPSFGVEETRPTITLRGSEGGTFGFLLSAHPYRAVDVERANGVPTEIELDGVSHHLPHPS